MNARELWKKRVGEWVFGSAIAFGSTVPFGGAGNLFGADSGSGSSGTAECSDTSVVPCTGPPGCTADPFCSCKENDPLPGSKCEALDGNGLGATCPTGCNDPFATKCTGNGVPMGPCYYES